MEKKRDGQGLIVTITQENYTVLFHNRVVIANNNLLHITKYLEWRF